MAVRRVCGRRFDTKYILMLCQNLGQTDLNSGTASLPLRMLNIPASLLFGAYSQLVEKYIRSYKRNFTRSRKDDSKKSRNAYWSVRPRVILLSWITKKMWSRLICTYVNHLCFVFVHLAVDIIRHMMALQVVWFQPIPHTSWRQISS